MAQLLCNFVSYSLKRSVDIAVILPTISSCDFDLEHPPCHTPAYRYPVLYLLHGYGNDYKSWLRYTSAERFAEEKRIALVLCNAENQCYMNTGSENKYYDFIAKELPEFICGNFPISSSAADTYMAGASMGGYGTLAHALTRPSEICAAGAFSPAVEIGTDPNMLGGNLNCLNLHGALEKCREARAELPRLFLCCGQKDFLYDSVLAFHQELAEKGFSHCWDNPAEFEHEWRFWDIELEKFLDWIPRTDPYSRMPFHKI